MKSLSFFLKLLSFGLLIFIWDYTFISYRKLPAIIPVHFDLEGNPNGYGIKMISWLLPVIATLLFGFLFYLSKNTKSSLLNIPQNIKENTEVSRGIVDGFNLLTMALFSVITYESIGVALGNLSELSSAFNYLLLIMFSAVIAILLYSYFISKKKNSSNLPN